MTLPLLLLIFSVSLRAADPPVGDYNNFRTIQFEGNKTYASDALRSALTSDSEVILRSHELAPLSKFLQVIESQLTRGYRRAGFPEVKVKALAEVKGIRVTIDEGVRCVAGKIAFQNADNLPMTQIEKRLTEKYPPPEELRSALNVPVIKPGISFSQTTEPSQMQGTKYLDSFGKPVQVMEPIWKPGDPAPFGSEEEISAVVGSVLLEEAILQADFSVEIEPQPPAAILRIKFKNHSKPASISKITFSGNKRNASADLLEYLGLKEGLPANQQLVRRTELLLYQSGRVQTFKVHLEYINESAAALNIDIVEAKDRPALKEPLGREELALLQFRNWLGAFPRRGDAIKISAFLTNYHLNAEMILSQVEGSTLSVEGLAGGPLEGYGAMLLLSSNAAGLFSTARGEKYFVNNPDISSFVSVGLRPSTEDDFTTHMELGFGMSSLHESNEPVFKFDATWAPVCFTRMAHDEKLTKSFAGDHLILGSEAVTFRIDEKSGRLVEFVNKTGGLELGLCPPGVVGKALEKHQHLANTYDPKFPVSTWISYVGRELLQVYLALQQTAPNAGRTEAFGTAAKKLFAPDTFSFLDELFREKPGDTIFVIPVGSVPVENAQANVTAMLAAFLFKYGDDLFPRHSWPWTVTREAVFVGRNETTYTGPTLDRLYNSGEMGPIGYYMVARLLKLINSPQAGAFATRGLLRLGVEDFRKDYRLLFQEGNSFARAIQTAAAKIPTLTPQEIEAVSTLAPWLKGLPGTLSADGQKPNLLQTFGPVFDEQWEASWRAEVRKNLRGLLAQ